MTAQVIVLAAVRNELHNLQTTLPAWKSFANQIVLCDQQSEDGTREWITANHPEVRIIENPGQDYDERSRGRILIDYCRQQFGLQHVLLYLDADETLCSGVFSSLEWQSFCKSKPGTAAEFPWINFWFSPKYYIGEAPFGSISYNRVAFIDDGRPIAAANEMHGMRGPGGDADNTRYFADINLLHYGYVPLIKNAYKQYWYKVWWKTKGGRNFHINRNHNFYHAIRMAHTLPSPDKWFSGYRERGIDVESMCYPSISWHALDILRRMAVHGDQLFHGIDIWDVDWEQMRTRATEAGYQGVSDRPIRRPPRYQKILVDLSRGPGSVRRMANSAWRFTMRKILP